VGVEPTHRWITPVSPVLKTGWATGPMPLRRERSALPAIWAAVGTAGATPQNGGVKSPERGTRPAPALGRLPPSSLPQGEAAITSIALKRRSAVLSRFAEHAALNSIVLGVCTVGLVVVAAALDSLSLTLGAVAGCLVLLLAATLAEAFPVPIEGVVAGATSIAGVFIVAAVTLYSWQWGVVVGVLTMVVVEFVARKPIVRAAYNAALYAISAGATGAATTAVAGSPLDRLGVVPIAGFAAFYLTDIVLLSAVVAASRPRRYDRVLGDFLLSTAGPFVTMAATTAIVVVLWQLSAYASLLLVPPLLAIVAYQRRLHRALDRQRELDRLKDEFVAIVSHELRTPLASVYGGIETLQRDSLTPQQRSEIVQVVRSEGARLARLVDDVLFVSRVGAPRPAISGDADAGDVADEVIASVASVAPSGIRIERRGADVELPRVAGNPDHLRRVLTNLVENAVKYSPDGGDVVVSARQVGDFVRIAVADEGIGIPEDKRAHIFEKFTRLDPEMTRAAISGSGLGLFICYELVEQMGGRISVGENTNGRGSVFTVDIPAVAAERR
jgi:signal transduction histidine kinase